MRLMTTVSGLPVDAGATNRARQTCPNDPSPTNSVISYFPVTFHSTAPPPFLQILYLHGCRHRARAKGSILLKFAHLPCALSMTVTLVIQVFNSYCSVIRGVIKK